MPAEPRVVFFDLGDTLVFSNAAGQRERFPDALDTLQVLQRRGYRLGLISNQPAGATVSQVQGVLQDLGLARYIESALITISTEIPGNAGKPNRPIFDLALEKAGHAAPSERSIFVTETFSHIAAARGFGWRAILKRNTGSCQPAEGECVASLSGLLDLLLAPASPAGTNLDLAPPPRLVDGLWAVPIDIQSIAATLIFDGATSSGTGDATMAFQVGPHGGNPIFDLRQSITGVWLDGASVPVSQAAHHDFGGGSNAELRVLEQLLEAGSTHSLRVTYTLGPPQASSAGSYQPAMTFSSGPRLAFNFGFTDLGAGRYLEAWIPANLIFDQFDLQLDLQLINSSIPHSVITNGAVTVLGPNHWKVHFPGRFTALSPMLEIRPMDSLASASGAITLPVSGASVTIEAWKPAASAVNLNTQITQIGGFLSDNENSTGPYIHGNRFVAFFNVGGMEYEGGTTTTTGALRHETFHSWWARGVKPAGQPDGWWDEAWTVYNDNGASETLPFNFSDAPVTLCPRNPWVRVTAGGAYTDGYRFWKGVAAWIGAGTLRSLMSEFYKQRWRRPVTTTDIEEFLVCRTGNPQLVDAFHRFVYGFGDPVPAPDLWLRDEPAHTGAEQWGGTFWNSPDLWVRNADDGGLAHQAPESGQDNWFYARVRNRGASVARHFLVTFQVKQFAGTQFSYPDDFLPCVAAASGFDLAPGTSVIVKARWPRKLVPPAGTHACLHASVLTRSDRPITGRHVWESNNLAQKNLTIVDLKPNTWIVIPVVVSHLRTGLAARYRLELLRPRSHPGLEAGLLHGSPAPFVRTPGLRLGAWASPATPIADEGVALDCEGRADHAANGAPQSARVARSDDPPTLAGLPAFRTEALFEEGIRAHIPVAVAAQQQLTFGLRLRVPSQARPGELLHVDFVQREARSGRIVGGVAVEIRVKS
ncbi:MAG: HAD hydrolase-like protein [Bryobacteraceae bacterium]|nr:HAD hydrolase-like protein [Bryobacteraceae bacterium]